MVSLSHHLPPPDKVRQTKLFQELVAERDEILRHKWLESEKVGRDIGWEKAHLDWSRKHRMGWIAARKRNCLLGG